MVQGAQFCQRRSRIGVRPAHSCVHLQTAPAPVYVCCRSFYDIQTDREGRLLTSCLPVCALQGHFQVVFSRKHCPLFQWRLGFFMRVRPKLYSNIHTCPALQLFGRQRGNAASTVAGSLPTTHLHAHRTAASRPRLCADVVACLHRSCFARACGPTWWRPLPRQHLSWCAQPLS